MLAVSRFETITLIRWQHLANNDTVPVYGDHEEYTRCTNIFN